MYAALFESVYADMGLDERCNYIALGSKLVAITFFSKENNMVI